MLTLASQLLAPAIAADTYAVRPAPAWVDDVPVELGWSPPDEHGQDGVTWLLLDRQFQRGEKTVSTWLRTVRRITTSDGLRQMSHLELTWDPEFERLAIHAVRVHRDGEVLELLRSTRLEVLRRETGLEAGLYDGTLSAVADLDGLRVGDVLELATSWDGINPVFDDRYAMVFSNQWSNPLHHAYTRLVWPEDRPLHVRTFAGATEPETRTRDGLVERIWDVRDPEPILGEPLTPSWYRPRAHVQVSEDATWADVVEWGLDLHRPAPRRGAALQARIDEWAAAASSDEERVDLVLDFLQEEVRYVGIEIGEGTHRPTAPDVVYERRFGDCKDKTRLLVESLRALGLEAWPAMVNTGAGKSIDTWLPSRRAFDHVIAAVMLGGELRFFDPTAPPEGDPPTRRTPPAYERALVIRPGETGLTEIPKPDPQEPLVEVAEYWRLSSEDASATVEVDCRYRGTEADAMRRDVHRSGQAETTQRYLNYYAEQYPSAASTMSVTSANDAEANVFSTQEAYTLSEAFATAEDGARQDLLVYANAVRDRLALPKSRHRVAPMAVTFPVFVRQTLRLQLAEGFTIAPEREAVERPEFTLVRTVSRPEKQVLEITWELRALTDTVAAADVPAYLDAISEARVLATFRLVRATPGFEGPFQPSWPAFMAVLLGGVVAWVACTGLATWIRSRPLPEPADGLPAPGIAGWLLLPAFATFIGPPMLLWTSRELLYVFDASRYDQLTTPLKLLTLSEVGANAAFLVALVLLIRAMIAWRREYPALFVTYYAVNLVVLVADSVAAARLLDDVDFEVRTLVLRLVFLVFWFNFMRTNARVRATFIR